MILLAKIAVILMIFLKKYYRDNRAWIFTIIVQYNSYTAQP